MANLFYPQLSSGAMTQYPFRKVSTFRTVKNILPDGRMIVYPDPSARRLQWQLTYDALTLPDVQSLQAHFQSCSGPLFAFTFLDPTDNLFTSSVDLTTAAWQTASTLHVLSSIQDPGYGSAAFRLTNQGQASGNFVQTLPIPSGYQYCLSLFARSAADSNLTMLLQGSSTTFSQDVALTTGWSRINLGGRLTDAGTTLTAGLILAPGQQVDVFGLQLEAQSTPSAYKQTAGKSGVYANAHWAMEEFAFTALGPDQYSTAALIEAALL